MQILMIWIRSRMCLFGPHSASPDLSHSPRNLQLRTNNQVYAQLQRPSAEGPKMTSRCAIPTLSPAIQRGSAELPCFSQFPDASREAQRNRYHLKGIYAAEYNFLPDFRFYHDKAI